MFLNSFLCKISMNLKNTNIYNSISNYLFLEYHSFGNSFERVRGFWELFSRFEFDFRRCGNNSSLNDSNFLCVRGSNTHNVAVHVPVLWLVCIHTVPFRMLWRP